MTIPAPLYSLKDSIPAIDPVQFFIHGPRDALHAMQRENVSRIEFEYGPDELEMLTLAYGCTLEDVDVWEDMRALMQGHMGAAQFNWKPPSDALERIRKIVLPLADYLNLALCLNDHEAWDRGAATMQKINPRLMSWMTACAGSCAATGMEPEEASHHEHFTHWACTNVHLTQDDGASIKPEHSELGRLHREYEARLRGEPDATSDRLMAEHMRKMSQVVVRTPLWRFQAAAMIPGPMSRSDRESEPGRSGARHGEGGRGRAATRPSGPQWEQGNGGKDPTPEESLRETEIFIAGLAASAAMGMIGARIVSLGVIITLASYILDVKEHIDEQQDQRRYNDLSSRAAQAERRFEQAQRRSENAESKAKVAEDRATAAEARAASADARSAAADRRAADAERRAADAERKTAKAEKEAAEATENARVKEQQARALKEAQQKAEEASRRQREQDKEKKKKEDEEKLLKGGLACVSPYAEPEVGIYFDGESFEEEIHIRMNWNARYAEQESEGSSIENVIKKARLHFLSLITFRPGENVFSRPNNIGAVLSEIISETARITTPPRPGRDGQGGFEGP